MLERVESPTRVSFARNPNYFLPGLPYADAVELMIDADPAAAFATFLAGKYDFGPEYGMVVRRSDLGIAKKRIRWLPTREYLMVSGSFTAMKLDQEPFKDVRVRRAVAMTANCPNALHTNPFSQGKA